MKTLTNLQAEVTEAPAPAVGLEQVVLDERHVERDGKSMVFWRELRLSPTTLTLKNGAVSVVIPVAELWKLGEQADMGLTLPAA